MLWVTFRIKEFPFSDGLDQSRTLMPHAPRVGETIVFPLRDNTWPRFEVKHIEYFVHYFQELPKGGEYPEGLYTEEPANTIDFPTWIEVFVDLEPITFDISRPATD